MGRRAARGADGPAPLYAAEELLGIVPADEREPYDVREVIARLVDGSDFLEFKPGFGADTLCGHARVDGQASASSATTARSSRPAPTRPRSSSSCATRRGTPLVFLQNTTGYMVGTAAERGGAIKHGAKMIQARRQRARAASSPFVIGGSFGAGNYGMCGRGFDPRFIFSWPNARTAVMGGAQAAKVMEIVGARQARAGRRSRSTRPSSPRWASSSRDASTASRDVLFGTARLWDDGIDRPARHAPRARAGAGARARGRARARCARTPFGVARF